MIIYLINYLSIFNGESSMRNKATELGLISICFKHIQKSDIYIFLYAGRVSRINTVPNWLKPVSAISAVQKKKKSSRGGPVALLKKKINVSAQQQVLEFELP